MSSIEIVFPGTRLQLDPESPGFAHGFGLFETLRLRGGRLELWSSHWQRLVDSAAVLGVACNYDAGAVLEAVRQLAQALPAEAVIKLSLLQTSPSPRLVVYSRPLMAQPATLGLLLDCPFTLNENSPLAGHKTHNYLENLLVLQCARAAGCLDAVRLNTQGHLAEGAISNLFFYRDAAWHTPALSCGLLPGVMRGALLVCLEVQQGHYRTADLAGAEAVFVSNSTLGLQPVDYLHGKLQPIRLQSRTHACYAQARQLLADSLAARSIALAGTASSVATR